MEGGWNDEDSGGRLEVEGRCICTCIIYICIFILITYTASCRNLWTLYIAMSEVGDEEIIMIGSKFSVRCATIFQFPFPILCEKVR